MDSEFAPECIHADDPQSECYGEVIPFMRPDGKVFPMCDRHSGEYEQAEMRREAFLLDAHEHAYAGGYEEPYWADEDY